MGEAALDAHVIYRDLIKAKRYEQAMPYWRSAFAAAPAADGKRKTHFEDGIKLYTNLLETTGAKKLYLDSIMYMYDRMDQCYDEPGYIDARKAFDLYYNYQDMSSNAEIYDHFIQALDAYGMESPAFIINPFTALLVERYTKEEIDKTSAVKYAQMILDITEKNNKNKKDGWPIVLNYAPARLEVFEVEKGFFDCAYYVEKYYKDFEDANSDCDVIETVLSRLKWGGCSEDSEEIASLRAAYKENCVVISSPGTGGFLGPARDALENGEYGKAIDLYTEYIDYTPDPDKKARFTLRIAKIYYAHLKNFSQARKYALQAANLKSGWGEPYIIIGKLYASSGPLCGPGRGWDSQIVTWPAIDKFQKAKQVDPSVAKEANKWIQTYSQYMPSREDIFLRQMTEGQPFTVGCWIQEKTTIRAAK